MARTADSRAKAKIAGYSRSSDPKKFQHSESYGLVFAPKGPNFAQEAF